MSVTPTNPFYDMTGQPMKPDKFRKVFKDRALVHYNLLWGIEIVTEFVGINHSPRPTGAPKIYETTARVKRGSVLMKSTWASGLKEALCVHGWYLMRVAFGAGLRWSARVKRGEL